jgi:hypothetical protein
LALADVLAAAVDPLLESVDPMAVVEAHNRTVNATYFVDFAETDPATALDLACQIRFRAANVGGAQDTRQALLLLETADEVAYSINGDDYAAAGFVGNGALNGRIPFATRLRLAATVLDEYFVGDASPGSPCFVHPIPAGGLNGYAAGLCRRASRTRVSFERPRSSTGKA